MRQHTNFEKLKCKSIKYLKYDNKEIKTILLRKNKNKVWQARQIEKIVQFT